MIDVNNISCVDESSEIIIKDVSFTIQKNDRVCILSNNNEHATILCHILAGILLRTHPTHSLEGEILFDKQSVPDMESHLRTEKIAYVPPNSDHLISGVKDTVFGEIALSLELTGMESSLIREKVNDIIRKLKIEHLAQRDPDSLSGGERHRIALAAMIVRNPAVLILDNPTMFLDNDGVSHLIAILRHYDGCIIIADPNPYGWSSFVQRFIVIQDATIRLYDTPQEFIRAVDSDEITCNLPAWIDLYRSVKNEIGDLRNLDSFKCLPPLRHLQRILQ